MSDFKEGILFVVGSDPKNIGGHFISTITLAANIRKKGYRVGFLVAPLTLPIQEFEDTGIEMFFEPFHSPKSAFFTRPFTINKVIRNGKFGAIVAGDPYSAFHATAGVIINKTPLVQIIPGGTAVLPPINIPGIVVFSQELFVQFQKKYAVPPEYIRVSGGQVDFDYFSKAGDEKDQRELGFTHGVVHILTVSRLVDAKEAPITHLLDQVEMVSAHFPVQCFVIGQGASREKLERYGENINARTNNRADIRFLGGFRINPDMLKQADLVVGQGRTIPEAIAAGVPGAVSGVGGYFGLVRSTNFHDLSRTNFTGRELKPFSTLLSDLASLNEYKSNDASLTYQLAFRHYDVSNGSEAILNSIDWRQPHRKTIFMNRMQLSGAFCKAWAVLIFQWLQFHANKLSTRARESRHEN